MLKHNRSEGEEPLSSPAPSLSPSPPRRSRGAFPVPSPRPQPLVPHTPAPRTKPLDLPTRTESQPGRGTIGLQPAGSLRQLLDLDAFGHQPYPLAVHLGETPPDRPRLRRSPPGGGPRTSIDNHTRPASGAWPPARAGPPRGAPPTRGSPAASAWNAQLRADRHQVAGHRPIERAGGFDGDVPPLAAEGLAKRRHFIKQQRLAPGHHRVTHRRVGRGVQGDELRRTSSSDRSSPSGLHEA